MEIKFRNTWNDTYTSSLDIQDDYDEYEIAYLDNDDIDLEFLNEQCSVKDFIDALRQVYEILELGADKAIERGYEVDYNDDNYLFRVNDLFDVRFWLDYGWDDYITLYIPNDTEIRGFKIPR